jgi:hypothetical protein
MSTWIWLIGAAVAGAGAYFTGWPTWRGIAARRRRDLNDERYLAWRGRAAERRPDPRLTDAERARLAVAVVLALLALFCLVGFVSYA